VLGPPTYPPQAAFHKRPKLIEPFDDAEVSEIVGSLRGPRTEHMRDDHIVLVAVELGTGLQSGEFLALLGTDVSQDNDGVVVRVTTGPSQRTVPVLRRWETHVAAAAERVGDRPLFMPQRRRVQRYDVTTFIGNLPPSTAPHLTIRRLRATWIVNHMRVGTPLNVLADAAGITTDQIGRFARHLPALAPDHARALLRGVER
jgi:integrase